jgi:hypothetical protein
MRWDEIISNQLFWFGGAAVLVLLVGVFAAYRLNRSKPDDPTPRQLEGWTPTGRIDFLNPESTDTFILQAEDTRIVDSMGGVEHREIRWRKATLDEAKAVVVAYHVQRNLAMTANFVVSNNDPRKFRSEERLPEAQPVKDVPPEVKSQDQGIV